MSENQLREFFHKKREKAKPTDTDWTARKDAWSAAVDRLYATVLDDYLGTARKEVEVEFADKGVTEDLVGQYRVREMVLRVGDEGVAFSPKGINVVGARGRIDVSGDRGEGMLVWHDGDRWSVVVSRVPTLRLVPLTADSLAELLAGVMRP